MPPVKEWTDPAGVPVKILAGTWNPGFLRNLFYGLEIGWQLLRHRLDYDITYFLMQGFHLAVGLPVCRLLGKPVVMKVSGSSIITGMRKSWLGRMELKWLDRWAHRVMVLNPGILQEARDAGLRLERLYWMPNPVDTDEFSPCDADRRRAIRASLSIAEGVPLTVFTGRLAPEKELPALIRAHAMVVQSLPDAQLVLAGDGPERAALERLCAELGIQDRVRFAGRVPLPEVRDWLQAADLFVLPSSNEGFSCSLVEAMACALPSVVSDIPANTQLIEQNVHGLIVPVRDEGALSSALLRLHQNVSLRREMGAAARRAVVVNYSTDRIMERYEGLFSDALARHVA